MRATSAAIALLVASAQLAGCFLDLDSLKRGRNDEGGSDGNGGRGGQGGSGGQGGGGGSGGEVCCLAPEQGCAPCGDDCLPSDCGGEPCALATGQGQPLSLAVAGKHVFWTSHLGNEVRLLDLASGRIEAFAANTPKPTLIAANGTSVVWVADDAIWGCPLSPTPCAGARRIVPIEPGRAPFVRGLSVDEQRAFWTEDRADATGATVMRCDIDSALGCSHDQAVLFSNLAHPQGIGAYPGTSGFVYWATAGNGPQEGTVLRMAKGALQNSTFEVVAAGLNSPTGVAITGDRVIWTTAPVSGAGGVSQCLLSEILCSGEAVAPAVDPNGPSIDGAREIASDGAQAYWANRGSTTVMKCALPKCINYPDVVASEQQEPSGVVVTESCVYWVDQTNGGRVLRKAK